MITKELETAMNTEWFKRKVTREEEAYYSEYREVTKSRETEGNAYNDWRPETTYYVVKENVPVSKETYLANGRRGSKQVIKKELVPYKDYMDLRSDYEELIEKNQTLTTVKKEVSLVTRMLKLLEEIETLAKHQVQCINIAIAQYEFIDGDSFIDEYVTKDLEDYSNRTIINEYLQKLENHKEKLIELEQEKENKDKQKELKKLKKEQKELQEKINNLK